MKRACLWKIYLSNKNKKKTGIIEKIYISELKSMKKYLKNVSFSIKFDILPI